MDSDLDRRAGWTGGLRELLERHPRGTWTHHRSATVATWLEVHDALRREAAALAAAADDYRAGRTAGPALAALAAPRLERLAADLRGHHETEDFHYFPVFRESHPRLAHVFDALGSDHERLHDAVADAAAALDQLLAASGAGTRSPAAGHAADRFAVTVKRLGDGLVRHLADEEDLVIPLLLELGD